MNVTPLSQYVVAFVIPELCGQWCLHGQAVPFTLVHINTVTMETFESKVGLRQGDNLSEILFVLFVNDLVKNGKW